MSSSIDEDASSTIGSKLPCSKSVIGPQLPPHLLKRSPSPSDSSKQASFGPQLPPHLLQRSQSAKADTKVIGPSLPPHLKDQLQKQAPVNYTSDDDQEDDSFGPLPPGVIKNSAAQIALEERALQLQMDQLNPQSSTEPSRESWMLELPEVKAANLGLGPRQFRNKAGPDMSDRSSWTEIPGQKRESKDVEIKKEDLKAEAELKQIKKRDKEQQLLSEKHKRKSKSLVEIHQAKLKKEDNETTERKPFNRETDLQVNRFDEAQKKAVLKKAQLLDDRFSSGKSKFL